MDLPILNQLEKIYPNTDTGADAIRKLVKNQNLIEQGIKEIDDAYDLDEVREQINVLSEYSIIDLPMDDGFSASSSTRTNKIVKNGKEVKILFSIKCDDGSAFANAETKVATIPEGYYPSSQLSRWIFGTCNGGGYCFAGGTSGKELRVRVADSSTNIFGVVSYVTD